MTKELTADQLLVLAARESLEHYIGIVHKTDDGHYAIAPKHLMELVIPALEDDSLGHTLIVSPPGSAKTNTMIGAVAWWLGRNPALHVGYFCNTDTRATERSMAVRDVIEFSPLYHAIFPDAKPNQKRGWSQDEWYLQRPNLMDKNPSFLSAGVTSSVLGARLDRAVFDDIADEKNMSSETEHEKMMTLLEKVFMTRLHPTRGRAIMICTRWSEDDPAAWAMERGWHTITIPALDEEGESYWPDYFPTERLRCRNDEHRGGQCCIYRIVGSQSFDQQYMGRVTSEESAIVKRSWWRRYDHIPDSAVKGCITVDTAGWDKHTTTGDYCVAAAWFRDGEDFYLADLWRARESFTEIERTLQDMQAAWSLPIVVEDVPWARPLIDRLRKTTWGVIPWKVKGSKANRFESIAPMVEAGNVWLPQKAPWVETYIDELAAFPNAKHDDQVDVTSMALIYLGRSAGRRNTRDLVPFRRHWERLSA